MADQRYLAGDLIKHFALAAAEQMTIALNVCMAWVRALTAVSRTTLRRRITSTVLVPDYC